MSRKPLLDAKKPIVSTRDYEKPRLEPLPDYLDTTLQQSVIIPGSIWGEQ